MLRYLMLVGQKGEELSYEQSQKLLAIEDATSDMFGRSVSISSGNVALVGAYQDDKGANSGSVYIFK